MQAQTFSNPKTGKVAHLIKDTQPFESLNVDFKGPCPFTQQYRNECILMIVDEYSKFPFAFPSKNVSARSTISHLRNLFLIFGIPSFIYSDCGSGFMSAELKVFLPEKGIATSCTISHKPGGNGLVEHINGTIWKAIAMALKSQQLPMTAWQKVLGDASNSVRSLLYTAINCTPHERMFAYQSKTTVKPLSQVGWLIQVLFCFKRYNRSSKFDPLLEEVELLERNPQHAHVTFSYGRENTVSA